jgi:hypothetical protein
MRTVGVISVATVLGCVTSGCLGGISLFNSEHKHYEGSPDMENRLNVLEQKVQILEQTVQTNRVSKSL